MTALQIIALIAFIVAVAGVLGYLFQSGKDEEEVTFTTSEYTPEELENIKLVEELYNKDLRPIIAKKAKLEVAKELEVIEPELIVKETKPEFPIDKPKKKRKYYPKKKQ
jgi:hypothetical protein